MILLNIALFAALSLLIKQMYKDTKESLNNKENEYFKDWNKKRDNKNIVPYLYFSKVKINVTVRP